MMSCSLRNMSITNFSVFQEKNPSDYPHEIIEFPAVLVSTESQQIVDHFHSFVRPVINPKLSDFCKNLTGIEQKVNNTPQMFLQRPYFKVQAFMKSTVAGQVLLRFRRYLPFFKTLFRICFTMRLKNRWNSF